MHAWSESSYLSHQLSLSVIFSHRVVAVDGDFPLLKVLAAVEAAGAPRRALGAGGGGGSKKT